MAYRAAITLWARGKGGKKSARVEIRKGEIVPSGLYAKSELDTLRQQGFVVADRDDPTDKATATKVAATASTDSNPDDGAPA